MPRASFVREPRHCLHLSEYWQIVVALRDPSLIRVNLSNDNSGANDEDFLTVLQ